VIRVSDTHPLIWLLAKSPRLSPVALPVFSDPNVTVVIPTLVLVEIKYLYAHGRVTVDVTDVLAHVAAAGNCRIHPLDERVVNRFPTTLNIHDAIIVATALMYRDDLGEDVAIITRDFQITASGLVPIVW
jgi:PIN domain nuclease of toxin-antitoxin system